MRRLATTTLFLVLASAFLNAQSPAAPSPLTGSQPERVKVYNVGSDVTAPQLLGSKTAGILAGNCKKNIDGEVELSLFVDKAGKPRNVNLVHPLNTPLDQIALDFVTADRFSPAEHDGAAVVVGLVAKVHLHACDAEIKDEKGKKTRQLQLTSQPEQEFSPSANTSEEAVLTVGAAGYSMLATVDTNSSGQTGPSNDADRATGLYKVGNGVSAPVPLNSVEAQFSDQARKAHYQGICLISMIVDAQGMPQNPRVVRALGMGLDQKALEAVRNYRFKPAMKDGRPVPVLIMVEVNFRLYDRLP